MAASGTVTLEMVGTQASMGSLAWTIAVTKVALGFVARSAIITLTGILDPAATSTQLLVTVN